MNDDNMSKILTKLSEHEIRIKHLEEMHSSILQIQATMYQIKENMTGLNEKVKSIEESFKRTQKQNEELLQKMVTAITNGYKDRVRTEDSLRVKKFNAIEKWVWRIIIAINTIILGYIGAGGHI